MEIFGNNAVTTLASALTSTATTISLATGTGALFPNPTSPDFFTLTLQNGTNIEICSVTARATDTLTVTRGTQGTTAQAFATSGTVVAHRLTAGTAGTNGLNDFFQKGYFNDLTVISPNPALPSSTLTTARMLAGTACNRPVLKFSDPLVAAYTACQPSLFNNSFSMLQPSSGTVTGTINTSSTHTGTMTTSGSATYGYFISLVSASTANSTASLYTTAQFNTSTATGGVFAVARAAFLTALGTGSTGQRFFVGFTDSAYNQMTFGDTHTVQNYAGFVMSTNLSETTWHFATCNAGGTETRVDTTMAWTQNDLYDFYIFIPPGGTTCYWRIDDLTAGTTQSGSQTATLPLTTALLQHLTGVDNLGTVANTMYFKKTYVETNL